MMNFLFPVSGDGNFDRWEDEPFRSTFSRMLLDLQEHADRDEICLHIQNVWLAKRLSTLSHSALKSYHRLITAIQEYEL